MTNLRVTAARVFALAVLMATAHGCRQEPRPEYFGTFAVVNGSIRELARERNIWFEGVKESNILRPDSYFMTWGPYEYPVLRRTAERDGKLTIGDDEITLRIAPVEGVPQLFALKPATPLQAGTYVFVVDGCRQESGNFRCYYPVGVE